MLINYGDLTLTNSALSHSYYNGLYHEGVSAHIRYNSFVGNRLDGVHNGDTSTVLNAEYNWWGDNSGPHPFGTGDSINYRTYPCGDGEICYEYYVDADPWLGKQEHESEDLIEEALPDDPLRNTAEKELGVPYIESVESQNGFFLFGASGETDRLTVRVDWNGAEPGSGAPGIVTFEVGDHTYSETGDEMGAEHILPVDNLKLGFNDMEIVAMLTDGTRSKPFAVRVFRFTAPQWLVELGFDDAKLKVTHKPEYTEAKMTVKFPAEPFEAELDLPDFIPLIGGKNGIPPSQASVGIGVRSDGKGSAKGQDQFQDQGAGSQCQLVG
jgi:hypothetical protein